MSNRFLTRAGAATALALAFPQIALAQSTLEAQAQRLFSGMGTTASTAFYVLFFIIGAFLLLVGGWGLYTHSRREHRGEGKLGTALFAFVAGFIMLGVVGFASLGTNSITGTAPGIKGGTGTLTF